MTPLRLELSQTRAPWAESDPRKVRFEDAAV